MGNFYLLADQAWPANIISTGALLLGLYGLLKWFLIEFVKAIEKRIDAARAVGLEALANVKEVREDLEEVKHNYLTRFEHVNENVSATREHLTAKLEEVNKDKYEHRIRQEQILGEIKAEVKNAVNKIDTIANQNPRNNG